MNTYDIYYLHQNQNVLNTIILLTNFESTCMEDLVLTCIFPSSHFPYVAVQVQPICFLNVGLGERRASTTAKLLGWGS